MKTTSQVHRLTGAEAVHLDEHVAARGPLPDLAQAELVRLVTDSGLTGRGGAAFPAGVKMQAVLTGPAPRVVVGNGAEGEPAAAKDKYLLLRNPHLVLDGLQLAARAIAADRAILYLHPDRAVCSVVRRAAAERAAAGYDAVAVSVVEAAHRFVAGEESAVVSRLNGGPALPRSKPPRVFQSGVDGRPTLLHNVETLAQLALLARHGADWFRSTGTADQPGTMLFTISGAVQSAGVVEAPVGARLADLLQARGADRGQAVLLGGYHGCWVSWEEAAELRMDNASLRPAGLSVGAGVVVVFPEQVCGLDEAAAVVSYLARETAGQCGPCVFGMPRLAASFADLARGERLRRARRQLPRLGDALERRGGCHHPDGSLRFVRTALNVFAAEITRHAHGRCSATAKGGVLPIPAEYARAA